MRPVSWLVGTFADFLKDMAANQSRDFFPRLSGNLRDKRRFLELNAFRLPTLLGKREHEALSRGVRIPELSLARLTRASINRALHALSPTIYTHAASRRSGAHILFAATDPGGYAALHPTISTALTDSRIARLSLVLEEHAEKRFAESGLHTQFVKRENPRDKPFTIGLLDYVSQAPVDTVIINSASSGSFEKSLMLSAKHELGARRIVVVHDPWSMWAPPNEPWVLGWENVDAVCVNDDLARRMLLIGLPSFRDKIVVTGTGQTDQARVSETERRLKRYEARERLGLNDKQMVLLFAGGVSDGVPPWPVDENERTAKRVLQVYREARGREIPADAALLFAAHPRDPEALAITAEYKAAAESDGAIIIATRDRGLSFSQVAFAADLIASTWSTETFLAPYRGIRGALLGFPDAGARGWRAYFGVDAERLQAVLHDTTGVDIVTSDEQLIESVRAAILEPLDPLAVQQSASGILDLALAGSYCAGDCSSNSVRPAVKSLYHEGREG